MRLIITGGAGFIGSHCVQHFQSLYEQILVIDNFSTGHNQFEFANVSYVKADITDEKTLDQIHGNFDHMIHLAAAISVAESMLDPQKYYRTNVQGSENVYKMAQRLGVTSIVSASSAAVYGDCGESAITEDFKYGGISPYAESKYQMEQLQTKFPKLNLVFTRFFNVYGPRQDPKSPYTGVMSIFIDRALSNRQMTIFGDGLQVRDFIYVKDIARAIQLAQEIQKFGGEIAFGDARKGDIKFSLSSCAKLRSLGWKAQTSLEKGIKETVEWFNQQKK